MTRFSTATIAILLSSANSTSAFTPSQLPVFRSIYSPSAIANEDTDFDAPVIVAAKPIELDHEIVVVDDECYLGKYGQYDECVDFDPSHDAVNRKAESEMPNFSSLKDEISSFFSNIFSKN